MLFSSQATPSLPTLAGVIWFSAEKRLAAVFLPGIVQLPSSAGVKPGATACGPAAMPARRIGPGGGGGGGALLQDDKAALPASAAHKARNAVATRRNVSPVRRLAKLSAAVQRRVLA